MKRISNTIAAFLAFLPIGNPLTISTNVALTSTAMFISIPKAHAGSASSHFRKAEKQIENEDYKKAIINLNKAIEKDSLYSDAYSSRGFAKYMTDDYEGAINDATKAIEIDPEEGYNYSLRADAKYMTEDYRGSISDANQAIGIDPEDGYAYSIRADAKYMTEDYIGSISDANQARQL